MNFTDEQLKAIKEDDNNIIVSAGAGSGKTAVLSERVLNKISKGVNIDELLILTFTKNAATEMKERIRKKLKENNLNDQLDLLDSAYITTFDAFVFGITRKYSHLVNIDSDIKIVDSSVIKLKKKDILNNIFDKLYVEKNPHFLKYLEEKTNKSDQSLKDLIIDLDNKIDLIIDKETFLKKYVDNFYNNDNYDKLYKEYDDYIKFLIDNLNFYVKIINSLDSDYYNKLYPFIDNIVNKQDITNLGGRIPASPRGSSDEFKYYKEMINEIFKELTKLGNISKKDNIKMVKESKDYISLFINILKVLHDEISIYKRKYNAYEYIDITRFAADIINNNDEIRKELKESFNEIMIDEYQDNNDVQEYIINLISNDNVYVVGDIKQSIYLFRNANPFIFKDKYESYKDGKDGIKIDLTKNFRSRKEVLDDVNNIFNNLMDLTIGDADYKESHQMVFGLENYEKEKLKNYNYNLEILNYEHDKENKKEEIEAFLIAKDIKDKLDNNFKVYDKDTNKLRTAEYKDFTIIMDRYSAFSTYEKVFTHFQIPFVTEQDHNIITEDELLIIKNIISLILNIKNNKLYKESYYNFTSIARSYLFSYSDSYIYDIVTNKRIKETEIYNIASNISKKVDSIDNKTLLELIIDEFDFYNKIIHTTNINYKSILLEELLNKFNDLNEFGYNIYDLNEFLDILIKDKDAEIKVNLKTADKSAVTITNIHKSKGLEYPVCYFSLFHSRFNFRDSTANVIYDKTYGFIPNFNEEKNYLYELYLYSYRREQISEKIRQLYVALTRAREKMIIVTDLNDESFEDNSTYKKFKYRSFNSMLYSIYSNIEQYIINTKLPTISNDYKYRKEIKFNYTKDEDIIVTEKNTNKEVITQGKFSKSESKLITKHQAKNINYGNHIHNVLENFNFKEKDFTNINEDDKEIINNLINQNFMQNINKANIYKEYEFIYEKNNEVKIGIIDLVLEYKNKIDIVDYKLKNIDDEDYIAQLKGYKEYMKTITNKEINIYLYSLVDKIIKKLD